MDWATTCQVTTEETIEFQLIRLEIASSREILSPEQRRKVLNDIPLCPEGGHKLLNAISRIDAVDKLLEGTCLNFYWIVDTIGGMDVRKIGFRGAVDAVVQAYKPHTFLEFECGSLHICFRFFLKPSRIPRGAATTPRDSEEHGEAWRKVVVDFERLARVQGSYGNLHIRRGDMQR
ncbi:uncharacterized protein TRAVEDRAFT_49511 [Trametes versicolor FP-101664 SS1]|uniref:uncharacterized protein n=1 Tax=Trametes versicolor (strain FP-101664) TaxID=717944 RepID=UPI000462365E|nr:uncharacterized protein TRAVEDRAFT_49511 [Trametes versicolor FP-101664 SS1]EIW56691.1 hypothetical protein TRAVEDRAFT_49511 [Trametes versicolor FP-101664 SS1]